MSLTKARTTRSDIMKYIQEYKSDIILGLACLQTILLIIMLSILVWRSDAQSVLRQYQTQELGGRTNYERYQEIITSDAYRQQQTFLIDQKHDIFFPEEANEPLSETGDLTQQ